MLLLVLILLATTVNDAAAHTTTTRSVLTFNTRLLEGSTPETDNLERRAAIIDGIRELDADVVCLQEVWIADDVEHITESLSDVYGHSFSLLHQTGELPHTTPQPPACDVNALVALIGCLTANACDVSTVESFGCLVQDCLSAFLALSQKCVGCIISIGLAHADQIFQICAAPNVGNVNDPGLVLLSKHPISAPTYTDYHPGITQLLRRGYINAKMAQSTTRCELELGNNRYVKVCEWKGELRVDIREWNEGKHTKKCIGLTLSRWKMLVENFDEIDESKKEGRHFAQHLGGEVYCELKPSGHVDIRKYWKPADECVPTKKGIYLSPDEYAELKKVAGDVGSVTPEWSGVVTCFRTVSGHII